MIISILLLGLTGCSIPPLPKVTDTLAAPGYAAPQPEVPFAGPVVESENAYLRLNGGTYSLAVKDTELAVALAVLSKSSPVPIVAQKGATGKVTVNVRNRPLGDILHIMLRPLGYTAIVEDGIIVVGKPKLLTRAFVINYLMDKRTSSSVTNASISSSGGSSRSSSGSASDSRGDSNSSSGSQGNVSVTTTGSTDFWTETVRGLQSILYGEGKKDGGDSGNRLVVNQLAGVLYVTAYPRTMEQVSLYLDSIENEIKRQVLIQAHIVEVELNDEFSLGIDWSAVLDKAEKFSVAQLITPTTPNSAFTLNFASPGDFTFLLDTFQEQGNVNMLSSPKISTLNNQKAVIKLTTKEVTWITSTIFNSTGDTLQTTTTPQIDEVGLFLDVTPNIAEGGRITMQVHPSITEKLRDSDSPGNTNSSKPVITVREVDTMVAVKSGQTVVIGGLISDRVNTVKRGVPLLGDIPYLGYLFSHYTQLHKKTELVIFLTPYILTDESIDMIRREHEGRVWGWNGISNYAESRRLEDAAARN
ncbi:secretin N-terminal domain-containing protein [Desulfuromonas soudanensis]|nr:secretin N-terminal domain-containing protein [Desulfuromonas soudanensis]